MASLLLAAGTEPHIVAVFNDLHQIQQQLPDLVCSLQKLLQSVDRSGEYLDHAVQLEAEQCHVCCVT